MRRALGLEPGMRVGVKLDVKRALVTAAPAPKAARLEEIQSLMDYKGPVVPVSAMRVTGYKD